MSSTMHDRRSVLWRLLWWTLWVLVVIYVLRHPSEAAENFRALVEWLGNASESMVRFLRQATGEGQ